MDLSIGFRSIDPNTVNTLKFFMDNMDSIKFVREKKMCINTVFNFYKLL